MLFVQNILNELLTALFLYHFLTSGAAHAILSVLTRLIQLSFIRRYAMLTGTLLLPAAALLVLGLLVIAALTAALR